jgi:energy-coupling factor transport system permease protein
MTRVDLYVPGESWLHRADPRSKLTLAICALVLLVLFRNVAIVAALLALLLALQFSAGVPWSRIRQALVALLPVSLLMFVLRSVFYPVGPALAAWGPIRVTAIGLLGGGAVSLRILAMGLAVLLWLFTTRNRDLVRGFVQLGVPFSWGMAFALAIRYLPDFATTYQTINQAQQARGLDLEATGWRGRIQKMMPIFIAMLISSLRRSEQIAVALEARAFGARGVNRTDLHPLRFGGSDAILAGSAILVLIIAVLVYASFGFGQRAW